MAAGPAGRAQPAYPGLARRVLGRYAFSWAYLGCFVVMQVVYAQLSAHGQSELTAWASTSVVNLEHDPAGSLVVSAFVTGGSPIAWTVLIALAVFGANRALGNGAVALVCLAGQVIGSLVSEGIVAYRVDAGQLPFSDRHLTDVGPSYVVMSAIVVADPLRRVGGADPGGDRPAHPRLSWRRLRRPRQPRRGRRRPRDRGGHRGRLHRGDHGPAGPPRPAGPR